jgi:hypothetical protein
MMAFLGMGNNPMVGATVAVRGRRRGGFEEIGLYYCFKSNQEIIRLLVYAQIYIHGCGSFIGAVLRYLIKGIQIYNYHENVPAKHAFYKMSLALS